MKRLMTALILFSLVCLSLPGDDIDPPDADGVYFAREPSSMITADYTGNEIIFTEELRLMYRGSRNFVMATFSEGLVPGYDPRIARSFTGSELNYRLLHNQTQQVLMDLSAPDAEITFLADNALNILQSSSPNRWRYFSLFYTIVIPADQIVSGSGVHSDTYTISLYTRNNLNSFSGLELYDTIDVQINIHAAGIVQLSIVEAGASPDFTSTEYPMNLGELEPGTTGRADLIAKATTSYAISVESSNRGKMVHHQLKDNTILYTMKVDGNLVDLENQTQPIQIYSGQPPTGEEGRRYEIEVVVGEFSMTAPGDYQDHITFTVTAH